MGNNFFLRRPRTSLGLPANNNNNDDSSVRHSCTEHEPDTRRATQEYLSRSSFGEPLARNSTTDLNNIYSGLSLRERSFKTRVESFVRKALHNNRDMRSVPELSSTDSGLTVNATLTHAQSSRPQSVHGSRTRHREATTPRTISRFRSFRERTRRNAVGPFSFHSRKPTAQDVNMVDRVANTSSPQQLVVDPNQSLRQPQPFAGAGARAAVAAAREPTAVTSAEIPARSQLQALPRTMETSRSRASNAAGRRGPSFDRNDTMLSTNTRSRPRQHESPDMGQRGYDEITQCEPAILEKILIDPIKILPTEISAIILAYLDDGSLLRAQMVSKAWKDIASSSAVWRSAFLAQYSRQPSNAEPYIKMGGAGLGGPSTCPQEWQLMAKARNKLEKNWKNSRPKAIYFSGHTDSVYCCQFDEDKIITGSRDRTVRVWDLNYPYKCRKVIGGPAARPQLPVVEATLETHPTNTIHNEPTVNGTPEGNAIFHIPEDYHSASILCLQFDSEILVTGSSDSTCIVWNIHTFQPIHRLRHHTAGVLDVCFDETFIISCSKDNTVCVWSRKTGELITVLTGHKGPVNAVQLREINGQKLLVSASGDGFSKLWNLARFEEIRRFESQDRGLAAVEFSDDGKHVLAGGNDQVIYKYDVETRAVVLQFKGHTNLVRSLFLDSANDRVLSGSYDQGIRVFDFNTAETIGVYENWTTSWILAAKSDYRRIVATSQDGRALLMDFGVGIPNIELLGGGHGKK